MNADLLNALTGVLVVVVPIVGGMATVALRKLAAKWGLEATAQDTANMESDVKAALNVGITKVLPLIEANGWNSPTVREAVLTEATDYLRQRFPDRTAQIVAAAQPGTPSSTTAITDTLAARLPDAMTVAAASPATPAAPVPPVTMVPVVPSVVQRA
jgi:hypothetical protein